MSSALVVGQLAMSLVLLVSAGLLLRALDKGRRVDPGFESAGVSTASFATDAWGYDSAKAGVFYRELRTGVRALPGVTAVSYTSNLPLSMRSSSSWLEPDGAAGNAGRPVRIDAQTVSVDRDYFDVVRIPLVQGRAIASGDDARGLRVAVVNETLARRAWPAGGAVGRTFRLDGQRHTVVGVARDAKYASLMEDTPPFLYTAMAQVRSADQSLLVRTSGDQATLATGIEQVVRGLDPAVPRPSVITLAKATSFSLLPQRVAAMVAGALGFVGLLLATVGLYGIMSYSASRRTREIGIRMALGARGADVQRLVVREGMRLAALGVMLGVVLAAGTARLIRAYLFGVSPLDATTFIGMSAIFVLVALLASWMPARRASRADPMVALRAG